MKTMILATVLSTITLAAAHAEFPEGTYRGQGIWKSAGDKGDYSVTTEIKDGSLKSTYLLPDGSKKEWNMEKRDSQSGQFQVMAQNHPIGNGYCLEYVDLCHYEIRIGDFSLEESYTIHEGKLYKYGSKKVDGKTIIWQESLEK